MIADFGDLKRFYDTPLGGIAARSIRSSIQSFWPDVRGMRVLALGYPFPYMRSLETQKRQSVIMVPPAFGCRRWPLENKHGSRVVVGFEDQLPFEEGHFDRVLLIHGLEAANHRPALLQELWRVLTAGGKLLAVVPNRQGLWARSAETPFGMGHPYFQWQLKKELRESDFVPMRFDQALFMPPFQKRMLLKWAKTWDRLGRTCAPAFSGVHLIEATKQIYAIPKPKALKFDRNVILPVPNTLGATRKTEPDL